MSTHEPPLRPLPPAPLGVPPSLRFGSFRFDRERWALERDGVDVALPPRALAVLALLLERPGALVGKRDLLDRVWAETHVSESSLTEAIRVLRQALGDDPQHPVYVQTVTRLGYRFIGPVGSDDPEETLDPAPSPPTPPAAATAPTRRSSAVLATALTFATLAIAALALLARDRFARELGEPRPPLRFTVSLPAGVEIPTLTPPLAVAPDGSEIVVAGVDAHGGRLYRRPLGATVATPIRGSDEGRVPFYSPDGRRIGFFAGQELRTIPVGGGTPVTIAKGLPPYGAVWTRDGIVVSLPPALGLTRIGLDGSRTPLTRPERERGTFGHLWPARFGDRILYTEWHGAWERSRIVALDPATGRRETLVERAGMALAGGDRLLYVRGNQLLSRRPAPGAASTLVAELAPATAGAMAAASADGGVVAYLPARRAPARRLLLLDAGGRPTALAAPGDLARIALTPDRERFAATRAQGEELDLWVGSVARPDELRRLTYGHYVGSPLWTDERHVAFVSTHEGPMRIYEIAADGTGERVLLAAASYPQLCAATPDGRWLLYQERSEATGYDLWMLDRADPARRVRLRGGTEDEFGCDLSPDGRFVSWMVDGDRRALRVADFPRFARVREIAVATGGAFWAPDGALLSAEEPSVLVRRPRLADGELGDREVVFPMTMPLRWLRPLGRDRYLAFEWPQLETAPGEIEVRVGAPPA